MLGMYIHMHWSYHHPYAARTWDLQDWRSYLTGLRSLGYDFIQIWPMLDSMPPEPTASDLAFLERVGRVIRLAQDEMGMKVTIVSCPNTIGNEQSSRYGFEDRPYFSCEWKVNPSDPAAVETLLAGRRKQFAPLSHADGIVIIDSDPGGYIGSTNEEFVTLMDRQIGVMRELNPAAELIYWMHFGWERYNRFWEATQRWQPGDPPVVFDDEPGVFLDTLARVRERLAEPWSVLANHTRWGHREATDALGLAGKRCGLSYGLIEGEPTFPFTNCDPSLIAGVMRDYAPQDYPRGFLANAQTHVLQLPHTYLVAEHWLKGPQAQPDLAAFGDKVIPGRGELLARAWMAVESPDEGSMRSLAGELRSEAARPHAEGTCSGLLLGSAERFLTDLAMNLEVRAGFAALAHALDGGGEPRAALRDLLKALVPYQQRLGFTDAYGGPLYAGLNMQVARLGDAEINAVLTQFDDWRDPAVRHGILPRLLAAVEAYCARG
jgi:hypothetical protein